MSVTNDSAAFTLIEPCAPPSSDSLSLFNARPCTSIALDGKGVEQRVTRISACLVTNASETELPKYDKVSSLTIKTSSHQFGSEHEVQIGGVNVVFSSRAYFRLWEPGLESTGNSEDVGGERMMRKRVAFGGGREEEDGWWRVHLELIAGLYRSYNEREDDQLSMDALNQVQVERTKDVTEKDIVRTNGGRTVVKSIAQVYTTSFNGIIPGDQGAALFTREWLKGSVGMAVMKFGDTRDLMMASGNMYTRVGVLWVEDVRRLNWLGLLLLWIVLSFVLILLRCTFRPIGMAELAGRYASREMGAEGNWDPWEGERVGERVGVRWMEDYEAR